MPGAIFETVAKCTICWHLSLLCFGIGAFLMASIASFSCSYFEVVDGSLGGQPINGTVGLLRYYNESTMSSCAFYEQDQINWDINLQIATISGWGAPIAAAAGVSFGLVQVLCWPLMNPCIICSGLVCSVFLWSTFFIHASLLCAGGCTLSTGAYFIFIAAGLVVVPWISYCSPPPIPLLAQRGVAAGEEYVYGGQREDETDEEYRLRQNNQELKLGVQGAKLAVGLI